MHSTPLSLRKFSSVLKSQFGGCNVMVWPLGDQNRHQTISLDLRYTLLSRFLASSISQISLTFPTFHSLSLSLHPRHRIPSPPEKSHSSASSKDRVSISHDLEFRLHFLEFRFRIQQCMWSVIGCERVWEEMAAGGFVTRAFDSMLKECSGKKYPDLQKAIQNYTGSPRILNPRSLFPLLFMTSFSSLSSDLNFWFVFDFFYFICFGLFWS